MASRSDAKGILRVVTDFFLCTAGFDGGIARYSLTFLRIGFDRGDEDDNEDSVASQSNAEGILRTLETSYPRYFFCTQSVMNHQNIIVIFKVSTRLVQEKNYYSTYLSTVLLLS